MLIEGAPGLGKTTTVTNLQAALKNVGGIRTVFCHEYDHPLHAFWTWGDGFDPNEKVEHPYSSELFIVRLMARTYAFLDQLLTQDQIAFVETYPFQSPVRNILKMLGTEADCAYYFDRFTNAVAGVSPVLVYFDHPHWRERMFGIAGDRGNRFNSMFFDAFYRSPYGLRHRVTTPAGVFQFYEEYQAVCERLIAQWPYRLIRFNPIELGETATVQHILKEISLAEHSTGTVTPRPSL